MSCVEHTICILWSTRNVLLGTRKMLSLGHKENILKRNDSANFRSIDRSIDPSIDQSVNQSTDPLIDQSMIDRTFTNFRMIFNQFLPPPHGAGGMGIINRSPCRGSGRRVVLTNCNSAIRSAGSADQLKPSYYALYGAFNGPFKAAFKRAHRRQGVDPNVSIPVGRTGRQNH